MGTETEQEQKAKYTMSYVNNQLVGDPEKRILQDFICHWSDTKPDEDAFIFLGNSGDREGVTWKSLYQRSVEFAKAFVSLGVQEQDVVGITLQNSQTCLFATLGAIFARAIPLGLQFIYHDGNDILAILNKVQTCSLFILDTESDFNTWRIFKTFLSSYSKSGQVSSVAIPSLRYVLSASKEGGDSEVLTIDQLLRSPHDNVTLPYFCYEDIVALIQTSGSTGSPKVVAHTNRSYATYAGESFIDTLYQSDEVIYNDEPFSWTGGLPIESAAVGRTRVLRSGESETATAHAHFVIDAIRKERCTMLHALPPLLRKIMDVMAEQNTSDDHRLVRTIWTGSQPVNKKLASCVGKLCDVFINVYGTTECLDVMAKIVTDRQTFESNNCGTVIEGFEAKIVDNVGAQVPARTRGELYVRGPTMFSGYFNEPAATRAVLSIDGWYKTDDICFMTEKGEFYVEGRISDTFVCGGTNVYTADLEAVLQGMPGILDAIIVPIPDDILHQVVCACLIVCAGSDVTESSVRKYCEDVHNDNGMFGSVLPTYYLFFDSFPETFPGKTKRKLLNEEAIKRLK